MKINLEKPGTSRYTGAMPNKKNTSFYCQLNENVLKVIIRSANAGNAPEFVTAAAEEMPHGKDEAALKEKIVSTLKKYGYSNQPIIISLTRNNATTRIVDLPTQKPEEIDKMLKLQAPKYLPYQIHDLITGYQVISTPKDGYTRANLLIVQKEIIDRYLRIFSPLKPKQLSIILSSFGSAELYNQKEGASQTPVILIDIGHRHAELIIIADKKPLLSRYISLSAPLSEWGRVFNEEVKKTQDSFLKESAQPLPSKAIFTGSQATLDKLKDILREINFLIPYEFFSYAPLQAFSPPAKEYIEKSDYSFASLIGLAVGDFPAQLELIPEHLKQERSFSVKTKKFIFMGMLAALSLIVAIVAFYLNISAKTTYLKQLRRELSKLEKAAQPLAKIDERLRLLKEHSQKTSSSLELVTAVSKAMPAEVLLTSLSFNEDSLLIIQGTSSDLNAVFKFAGRLEAEEALKGFTSKVNYATQRRTIENTAVDFEITAQKKSRQ